MSQILEAGLARFHTEFDAEAVTLTGPVRAAGRPTKAHPNGEDSAWWRAEGPAMVNAYYAWRLQNPNLRLWEINGTPAVELEVSCRLDGDVTVKGFLDRVFEDRNTGDLIIVDLKTGKTQPPPIQLAFYRLMLHTTVGVDAKWGAYWMARTGTLSAPINLEQYSMAMTARWIRDVKKAIDLNIFVPHVGQNCGWCGVKPQCYVHTGQHLPHFESDLATSTPHITDNIKGEPV